MLWPGFELEIRLARDAATAVTDAAEYGIHAAGTAISYAAQAGSRVYHAVTKVAEAVGHAAVHVVKTAYHEAAKAVTATVTFVKRHAALITSIVVGAVVFSGCETPLSQPSRFAGSMPVRPRPGRSWWSAQAGRGRLVLRVDRLGHAVPNVRSADQVLDLVSHSRTRFVEIHEQLGHAAE